MLPASIAAPRFSAADRSCPILDGPTNHLDLESITALNNGLLGCEGAMLFASQDVKFVESLANRVLELQPDGSDLGGPRGSPVLRYLRRP